MEMDEMPEGRVYFMCILHQGFKRMIPDKLYKIEFGKDYLELESEGNGWVSGLFSFMLSSNLGNVKLDGGTLDAWFNKARIALCMSRISIEKLMFTGGKIIFPDGSKTFSTRWSIKLDYEKTDNKFKDKDACRIKENYNMIQKYTEQGENNQFINNVCVLLNRITDDEKENFFNKWVSFNLRRLAINHP